MTTIWGFDPGKVTGIARGTFTDTQPFKLDAVWALEWDDFSDLMADQWRAPKPEDHVIVESFTPNSGNEFTLKREDIVGVQVEGVLRHYCDPGIVWQGRSRKAGVPDAVLKSHGLWQVGSSVAWTDGRDANDAIIHILEYLRASYVHIPTLNKYFRPARLRGEL